jgi:hypothetical protein
MEIVGGVQADHASRCRAAGAARALHRRRLAHTSDIQRRQPGPRGIDRRAREARIDHRGHSFDGHRAFGDVGRKDYLAPIGGRDCAILLGGR